MQIVEFLEPSRTFHPMFQRYIYRSSKVIKLICNNVVRRYK